MTYCDIASLYPSVFYTESFQKKFEEFTNTHREEIDKACTQAIMQTLGIPNTEPKKRKYDLKWR